MQQENLVLVQALYAAYMAGDRSAVAAGMTPNIRWHNSGFDPTAGTYEGVEGVLGFLMAENHLEDFALEVVDMLSSDERVAIIARTTGRRGSNRIVNDFVQVIRLEDRRVSEVWNYYWDQRALAQLMSAPV